MAKTPDPKGKKKNGKKKIKTRIENEFFMPPTIPMSSLPTHMPNNISSPPPPSTQVATITPSITYIPPSHIRVNAPIASSSRSIELTSFNTNASQEPNSTTPNEILITPRIKKHIELLGKDEDPGIASTFKKLNTTTKKDGEVVWRNDYYKDNNVTQNQTLAINTENNDVGNGTQTSENEPLTEAQAWLDATGGPNKRGRIPGLGGEAIFLIRDHPFPLTPPPGYPYPTVPPPGYSFSPDPPTRPSTQSIQQPSSDHVFDKESD
ncbi:hypothetical protein ACFE04_011331 [Oxalis oulophora]